MGLQSAFSHLQNFVQTKRSHPIILNDHVGVGQGFGNSCPENINFRRNIFFIGAGNFIRLDPMTPAFVGNGDVCAVKGIELFIDGFGLARVQGRAPIHQFFFLLSRWN